MRHYTVQAEGHVTLNTELAKPIGIVNGLDVTMRRKPRLSDGKSHVCKVTKADGTVSYITRNKREAKHVQRITGRQAVSHNSLMNSEAAKMKPIQHDFNSK